MSDLTLLRAGIQADLIWTALPEDEADALTWEEAAIIACRKLYVDQRSSLHATHPDAFKIKGPNISDKWMHPKSITGNGGRKALIQRILAEDESNPRYIARTEDYTSGERVTKIYKGDITSWTDDQLQTVNLFNTFESLPDSAQSLVADMVDRLTIGRLEAKDDDHETQ